MELTYVVSPEHVDTFVATGKRLGYVGEVLTQAGKRGAAQFALDTAITSALNGIEPNGIEPPPPRRGGGRRK